MDSELVKAMLCLLTVYERRRDLQEAFPEVVTKDYLRLLEWACANVEKRLEDSEYNILKPYGKQFESLLSLKDIQDYSIDEWANSFRSHTPVGSVNFCNFRRVKPIARALRYSTVIIPAYKNVKSLKRTLMSIDNQSVHNFEVIVVCDGCDRIASFMKKFKSSFKHPLKVHNINHRHGFGVVLARNLGASLAKGEQLIFIDSDTTIDTNVIEIYQENYENNCLLIGWVDEVDPETKRILYPEDRWGLVSAHVGFFKQQYGDGGDFWTMNASVDTDSFTELGGFDMAFLNQAGEDSDFGFRHFAKFGKIKYLVEAKAKHFGISSGRKWGKFDRTVITERLKSDQKYYTDPEHWVANGGASFLKSKML